MCLLRIDSFILDTKVSRWCSRNSFQFHTIFCLWKTVLWTGIMMIKGIIRKLKRIFPIFDRFMFCLNQPSYWFLHFAKLNYFYLIEVQTFTKFTFLIVSNFKQLNENLEHKNFKNTQTANSRQFGKFWYCLDTLVLNSSLN